MTRQARTGTQRPSAAVLLLVICAAAFSACSRGVSVQTQPSPVYAISVENATTDELVVSYDDGSAFRALGTVLPGRSERFIIASSTSPNIEVIARSGQGARSFGPYQVTLRAGTTVPLVIR
jgi:hypothetical protein